MIIYQCPTVLLFITTIWSISDNLVFLFVVLHLTSKQKKSQHQERIKPASSRMVNITRLLIAERKRHVAAMQLPQLRAAGSSGSDGLQGSILSRSRRG